MSHFQITGGAPLEGALPVHGAKNSVLPILAACLLAREQVVLHNCPDLTDVTAALAILEHLGCSTRREGDTVAVSYTHLDVYKRQEVARGTVIEVRFVNDSISDYAG